MPRAQIVSMMALVIGVPLVASFLTNAGTDRPCFSAGRAAYEISKSPNATYVVRVDKAAVGSSLRMQIVDDPAGADFVLVDDGEPGTACRDAAAVETVRVDPAAAKPSLTVALSRAPGDYKIYVRSARYSAEDAAALFAVIARKAAATGSIDKSAKRN